MDQSRNGVVLLTEADLSTGQEPTYGQLKQMLPECFVSVKLETYEDSGTSEQSAEGILRTACCNQPANSCTCSDPKPNCVVITPAPSSAPFTCQFLPSTNMMPQSEQQQATTQASAQPSPQSTAHSRPPSSTHTFSQAHTRTAEMPWLSHGYAEPVITTQGGQQFQHHQMQYLTTDGTVVTQATGDRIMIKQSNPNSGSRNENANIISTVSGLSGAETCDPNTFINYVLNQQRSGAAASSIFLSFEPTRNIPSQIVQQSSAAAAEREEVPREASHDTSINLKLERHTEESSRNSTPAENSDNGSAADSPNPGEVVGSGNQVSRYCQTMPITPQQQDAKTSTDDFEEELAVINGTNSGGFVLKQGLKHIAFGHIRPTVQCQSPLNSVDGTNGSESQESEDKCHNDQGRGESHAHTANLRRQIEIKTADPKLPNKLPIPTFSCLDPVEKVYRCEICGKTYHTQQALINHDRYHRGERPYECETCHKAFATNSHLVTHRRTHTGERPFQCQVCQRCFADRSAFMKHERTHGPNGSIIKRYKCEECGNGFVDSCGLKKHTRIHTGERPYICLVCSKAFSTSSTFVAHKRIHTGERPYKCESCEKMFVTKSHLLTHRRKHTGEKPFTCSVCNRCFADGSSFRRHERLHTGEQRHVCDLCGRGFPSDASLERHRQGHLMTSTPISPSFSYMYENRSELNNLTQAEATAQNQQPQPEQHCVLPQESLPTDSNHSNVGVDLSQEMAS